MKKISRKINNINISRLRFVIQIFAFVLFVYGGYFFIHVGQQLPTFACPYVPGSPGTCYLIAMQHGLHLTWSELFGYRGLAFLTGFGIFLLFLIVLNKAWCGFFCPLGTLQDWITRLRKKTGIRFSRYEERNFKKLKLIKYGFLIIIVLIPLAMSNSFFGLPRVTEDMSAPFCQMCPGRTVLPVTNADTSQIFIDFTSTTTIVMSGIGMAFMALFFVGSFVKKRFFCFFCPMSALQFLFTRIGILRMTKDGDKCTRCGNCFRVCDVGILAIADDISSKFIVKDDCMMCFKCVEACPEEGCLNIKTLNLTVFKSTEEGFFKRHSKAQCDENTKQLTP